MLMYSQKHSRYALRLTALVPFLFSAAVISAGETLERPPITLSASKVLPESLRSGEGFTVQEEVINDGAQNTYVLKTDYGDFTVTSDDQLRARLQEIRATKALEELENSEEFKEAAERGIKGMYEGGKALVQEPVETTKNAARGVGRWLRNVGSSITSEDPHQDNALETITGYDAVKRAYALELRVDPYTDFEPFQKHLGEVAKAATAGGLVTRAAVKVSTAGTLAGTVADVTSLAKMKDVIKDNPPATLESINREKLLKMGIPEYQADLMLKNYNYTPVEMTIMVEALNRMGEIEGREVLVAHAASAPDRGTAFFMAFHTEMLANYIDTVEKADIVSTSGNLWLVTEGGTLVGAFPLDYLAWGPETAKAVEFTQGQLDQLGVKKKEFLMQGRFSPTASQALKARGWEISDSVDLRPRTAEDTAQS